MILPSKHEHPDLTLLTISAVLLKRIKKAKVESLGDLRAILREHRPEADPMLMPALFLLYLLGLIEYHPKTDTIAYVRSR